MTGGFSLIANSAISWKPLLRFLLRNSGYTGKRFICGDLFIESTKQTVKEKYLRINFLLRISHMSLILEKYVLLYIIIYYKIISKNYTLF